VSAPPLPPPEASRAEVDAFREQEGAPGHGVEFDRGAPHRAERPRREEGLSRRPPRSEALVIVVYVAGPFRGADGWEIAENVHRAEQLAREVARLGAMPLTPHSIGAKMHGTETDTFWLEGTLELLRRCDAAIFTSDWRRSTGARGEMAEAARLEKPVFYSVESLRRWLERTPGSAYTPFPEAR